MARTRRPPKDWPAWRYGPDGQSGIFDCAADVPPGWTSNPDEPFVPVEQTPRLDRTELTALLNDRGIYPAGNWSAAYMKEQLDQ